MFAYKGCSGQTDKKLEPILLLALHFSLAQRQNEVTAIKLFSAF